MRSEQPSHLFSGSSGQNIIQSHVRVGDLCIFRRIDCEKVLLGGVVKFSYLVGTKKQREYSSSYVDMTKDSYKNIGVFSNYIARFEVNDLNTIHFRFIFYCWFPAHGPLYQHY